MGKHERMLCGIATYGQILDQLVLEIVLFRLDPGLLVTLEEQVHGSVPGKQRIRSDHSGITERSSKTEDLHLGRL